MYSMVSGLFCRGSFETSYMFPGFIWTEPELPGSTIYLYLTSGSEVPETVHNAILPTYPAV